MHVYRNRRYEEEIVMLIWHKKGEQGMIETHKQKARIQAHHKITDSATQTHTHRNKRDVAFQEACLLINIWTKI